LQQLDTLKLEALVKELELQNYPRLILILILFQFIEWHPCIGGREPGRARKAITELSNILRSSMQVKKWSQLLWNVNLIL
jgi:hypothetical protein